MKRIVLTLLVCFCIQLAFAQKNTPVVIATYNIRYNNAHDSLNAWPNRKENVKALIRFHEFDIFGTQEGLIEQINGISELEAYARTGHGRDDGKEAGEHSAIFYKKDRFKLLESGDFWLSEIPEKPGKGWDAKCCNRICSWGKFQDQQTRKTFYFFSVHFDHQGVIARRESGKLMVKKIQEIAKNAPVICVGDFNSTPETEQIKTMQTILNDSYKVTQDPPYGPVGTFNSFRFTAPMKNRIDYIFVSKGIKVLKYGVLTDAKDQRYPSDHQPVMIKAVIN
ncbi:endonuclease/exonuclease/phosphatase family protein [Agriterribacter sp.]|uniref:endonuclease/exonuclease/phosphatase family protein n=1 Tax=Agriterribacter sp. TaxID=2821509 RepID=UPI002C45E49B|nr:endonuclease/exonuclease/phosphatase family protein [Agriterribacter sp.]HRP58268.1 endonuclease/exonuclease/phosphatase family protein [Agriterribacter sp.]